MLMGNQQVHAVLSNVCFHLQHYQQIGLHILVPILFGWFASEAAVCIARFVLQLTGTLSLPVRCSGGGCSVHSRLVW
jgi:hypothetical protein